MVAPGSTAAQQGAFWVGVVDGTGDSAADGWDSSQAPWVASEGGWGVADGVGGVAFPEGVGDEGGLVGFEAGAFGVSADAGHSGGHVVEDALEGTVVVGAC